MSNPHEEHDARASRADVDDVADAAIGVDTRIFRTLWDTFIHTPRVVEAAFAGDRDKYVPIIRLFLVLFGALFAIMAFAGLPIGMSLESLETAPDTTEAIRVWLEQGGQTRESVDLTLERLSQLTTTPIMFLGTLPFLLLLKLYRPSRSLFGHLLAFLAATNSSYLVLFPFFIPMLFGYVEITFLLGMAVSLVWYFGITARLLHRFYTSKAWVVALYTGGLILAFPVMIILTVIAQYGLAEFALRTFHDLSIFDLFMIDPGIAPEDTSP